MKLAEAFDRAIGVLSPAWAARRKIERYALSETARLLAYRDANPGRLDRPVVGRGATADWNLEQGFDRRRLVDRARQQEEDNLLAGALLDRSTDSVVGDGYRLQARSSDKGWNAEFEEFWRDWAEHDCDARGMHNFDELLELYYRSWQRDGDVAFLLNADGTIRIVESDEIATPEGGYNRPSMADGVELDAQGRPVAFHVFDPDPNVLYSDRRMVLHRLRRIPAENVVFLPRHLRAGQTRGLTAFNGIFWLLEQLDGTVEAVTVAHRMAALFGLVIKKKAPFSGAIVTPDTNGTNRPQISMEPGSVMRLEPDEDVTQVTPAHPTAQSREHVNLVVRLCSTRFALPLEIVLGDYTGSNYANMRAALIMVKKSRKRTQNRLGRAASEVVRWKGLNWIDEQVKTANLKRKLLRDALKHRWVMPGQPWIDPVAEIQAAQAAVDSGLDTYTNIAAGLGMEFEELLEQRERELKAMRDRGLPEVRSTLTRDPVAPRDAEDSDPPAPPKP